VPREKPIRLLSYFGSLVAFPVLAALVVGLVGHDAMLGVKTFLLIALGLAIVSPLLTAVIASGKGKSHRHRGK
jgi:hypothetical protein